MGCGASTAQGHASGSAGVPHTQAPPAQQPQPQPSSALEAGYARHQALISGGVKVAAALVGASGFPGAGLLAEAMLKVQTGTGWGPCLCAATGILHRAFAVFYQCLCTPCALLTFPCPPILSL